MNKSLTPNALLISLIMLLTGLNLSAADINNSLAAYLRMGVGARVIAMGEAGSTVSQDVVAGFWNPAGLASLKDLEVATMYKIGMGFDRSHNYAAIGKNFRFGALAFSWMNASVGDIDGYDTNGNPTGSFSTDEHCLALSYALDFNRLSLGLTPKFYYSSYATAEDNESGYGVDLGVRYDINQYLEAGAMVRDAYGVLGGDRIPYEITAGLAVYPLAGITLAADAKLEQDEDPLFCFGAEYWTSIGRDPEAGSQLSDAPVSEENSWSDILSDVQTGLRLGYNDGQLSAGTGIKFRNFQLDYTFRLNNHEIFNDDHILSLILRF